MEKILWDFEYGNEKEPQPVKATVSVAHDGTNYDFKKAAEKFCKKQFNSTDEKLINYIAAKMDEAHFHIALKMDEMHYQIGSKIYL